jgi:hypothetical protein
MEAMASLWRWTRSHLSLFALGVTVVAAALLLSVEFLNPEFRSFWIDHALLAGMVVAAIQLGLTIFVLEFVLDARERSRWQTVSRIAAQALGESAVYHYRSLWWLAFGGPDPALSYANSGLTTARSSFPEVRAVIERHGLHEVEIVRAFQGDVLDDEWDSRFLELLPDLEWIRGMRRTMSDIHRCYRLEVAQWASALTSAHAGSEVLEAVSSVAHSTRTLIALTDHVVLADETPREEDLSALLDALIEGRRQAVLLRERLQVASGEGARYTSRMRNALPLRDRRWLDERPADLVKAVRPSPIRD